MTEGLTIPLADALEALQTAGQYQAATALALRAAKGSTPAAAAPAPDEATEEPPPASAHPRLSDGSISHEELLQMSREDLRNLKASDPQLYASSMAALVRKANR
jgi:hypothetical protein